MKRRFGRSGARFLWIGIVTTLLGGLGACGDGEDTPIGNGGASTGGKGSGNGGAAGMGGSRVSGGFSGSTAKGGNGGGSGASTGGAGGTPAVAGEAGTLGEGGTAPNAGASGSGGGAELPVEYRGCETGAAITRIALYRIDRAQQTCTLVMVQQGLINCLDGLTSGGWCVTGAAIGNDIEACEAFQMPSDPIQATAGEGTFTISTQPLAIDIDVEFEFPASSGLPESISVAADNCLANCAMNDCRPVE